MRISIKALALYLLLLTGLAVAVAAPDAAPALDASSVAQVSTDAAPGALDASPLAATPPSPDDPGFSFLKKLFDLGMSRQWQGVAAMLLIAFVWIARKWGAKKLPWLATPRGGAVLVLTSAVVLSLANAAIIGKLSLEVALQAAYIGFLAGGGWTVVKKLIGDGK